MRSSKMNLHFRGNDRWWDDIKKYNKENAPNYIFATDNKEVNTGSFDASGVAKWMLYMYSDGTLNTYMTGGCRAVSIEDCSPSAFNSALNSYMALRNYTAHSSADAEDLDTEDLFEPGLPGLLADGTPVLLGPGRSPGPHAACPGRNCRGTWPDNRTPRRIRPGVPSGQAMAGGSQIHTGNSCRQGRKISCFAPSLYGEGLPFPLKAATLLPPFLVGPWSARSTHRRSSPAKSGPRSPASMSTSVPKCQEQNWSRAFCTALQGPIPPKELPEMDYASRQPFLKGYSIHERKWRQDQKGA